MLSYGKHQSLKLSSPELLLLYPEEKLNIWPAFTAVDPPTQ